MNYFTDEELSCPCCGVNGFKVGTLIRFNKLRGEVGSPMNMTSGYRCEAYNTLKGYTQTHATGQAGDIACSHAQAFEILARAKAHGFTGIGVKQKGKQRFLHLDDLEEDLPKRPRPHVWSY